MLSKLGQQPVRHFLKRTFPEHIYNRSDHPALTSLDEIVMNKLFQGRMLPLALFSEDERGRVVNLVSRELVHVKAKNIVQLTPLGNILSPVNSQTYFAENKDFEKRHMISSSFNMNLVTDMGGVTNIFDAQELATLHQLNEVYARNKADMSAMGLKRESERITFEYVYKSSEMEGSGYDAFDTEELLKTGATGMSSSLKMTDAIITLNHKAALDFVHTVPADALLDLETIEKVHRLLTENIGRWDAGAKSVSAGVRDKMVGITNTKYRPPPNKQELLKCYEASVALIRTQTDTFSQSLLATLLLSYMQLFEDGNKRTARMIGYAILVNNGLFPITYRGADNRSINRAVVLFDERNNIGAFKTIFKNQAEVCVSTYFNPGPDILKG